MGSNLLETGFWGPSQAKPRGGPREHFQLRRGHSDTREAICHSSWHVYEIVQYKPSQVCVGETEREREERERERERQRECNIESTRLPTIRTVH